MLQNEYPEKSTTGKICNLRKLLKKEKYINVSPIQISLQENKICSRKWILILWPHKNPFYSISFTFMWKESKKKVHIATDTLGLLDSFLKKSVLPFFSLSLSLIYLFIYLILCFRSNISAFMLWSDIAQKILYSHPVWIWHVSVQTYFSVNQHQMIESSMINSISDYTICFLIINVAGRFYIYFNGTSGDVQQDKRQEDWGIIQLYFGILTKYKYHLWIKLNNFSDISSIKKIENKPDPKSIQLSV